MGSLLARLLRFVSVKTSLLVGYLGVTALCGVLVAALALPAIAVLAYGTNKAAAVVQTLPQALPAPQTQGFTRIYDRNNVLIATFYEKNQVPVPLSGVAPIMQKAQIDIEDQRFYQHGAADSQGILRAAMSNAAAGQTVAGGSTLTQQYVKNVLQDNADTRAGQRAAVAQTPARKVEELRYAIGVEKSMTKEQILQGYLNIATYGRSVYGIQAASLYYFGIPATKLDLPQAAMIAGMTKSPSSLDPTGPVVGLQDPRRDALARRNVVLDKMHTLNDITDAQWQAARKAPLGVINGGRGKSPQRGCLATGADWYCDYLRSLIVRSDEFAVLGATPAQRQTAFTGGGLTIHTNLDLAIQKQANEALHKQAKATDEPVAATAVVRPGTGGVLAVASSKNLAQSSPAPNGSTFNNYAVPYKYGNTLGFQPGSTMKSFTAAAALNDGLSLDTVINAPYQVDFSGQRFSTCKGSVKVAPGYKPSNASRAEDGPVTMNEALQASINTYFLLLEQQVGLCKPVSLATAAGITRVDLTAKPPKPAPFQQYPTFTLGANETTPLQMSEAYAMFGARGIYCKPWVVSSIERDGKAVYSKGPDCKRLLPEGVADAISWSLYHNVESDQGFVTTAQGLAIPGIPYAAKTGTTNDSKAVWYNGFNSQFASSLAIGNSKSGSKPIVGERLGGKVIPKGASGASVAGKVWLSVMSPILQAQSEHPGFVDKPDPQYGGQDVGGNPLQQTPTGQQPGTVPDVVGLSEADATSQLQAQGFTVLPGRDRYPSAGVPAGQVIRTYPVPGQNALPGSVVIVYVSRG